MSEKDFSNKIYRGLYSDMIDCHDIRGTYIMCDYLALEEIQGRLSKQNQNKLYYLGNGNYHYLTLTLLKQINDPFTLVTFDHHNDAGYLSSPQMTSCGSWIQNAVEELDLLEEVLIIGADSQDKKETKASVSNKIRIFEDGSLSEKKLQMFSDTIKTKNIYMSIDRDFLSTKEVQTNWDQGEHQLSELLKSMNILAKNRHLIGADVCGDIVWSYQKMSDFSFKSILEKSINVNEQIFTTLGNFL